MEKFFVYYDVHGHGEYAMEELDSKQAVLDFLNKYAGAENFEFTVIQGRRIEVKPAQVATEYRFA